MKARLPLLALALCGCMGGPVAQAPACSAYVDCIRALDALDSTTTDLDRFVPGGACWNNGDLAELCTSGCERALARLRERTPVLPEACAP